MVEQVDRAVGLAENLIAPAPGQPLFATIELRKRLTNLRAWMERTGAREDLGLPVIPAGPLSPRMLRRTLALAVAQRPAGLLAAKVALKHVSVATTEGYTARPGGSQRLFHTEIEEAEHAHHLRLTVQAFRDYQAGTMPAGPGARSLIATFAHVDTALTDLARTDPTVLHNERRLENLLRRQASTLHVAAANYCWFQDPTQALCLRLAATPQATRPLVGMCDSARCPQATHHPCHQPVWQTHAAHLHDLLDNPRPRRREDQAAARTRPRRAGPRRHHRRQASAGQRNGQLT